MARVYDERPAGICESKAEKLEPSFSRWSFVIHSCYALSVIQFLQTLFYSVMNDQRVTPEPLMHNHNAGSAKHGGIVRRSRIVHQRTAICAVRVFKALSCQVTEKFF